MRCKTRDCLHAVADRSDNFTVQRPSLPNDPCRLFGGLHKPLPSVVGVEDGERSSAGKMECTVSVTSSLRFGQGFYMVSDIVIIYNYKLNLNESAL